MKSQLFDQRKELGTGLVELASQCLYQHHEVWAAPAELTSQFFGQGQNPRTGIVARTPRELVQCQILGTNHRTRVSFP